MSEAFRLTEDQELFRKEWRRLFEDKFTKRAAEIDLTGGGVSKVYVYYAVTDPDAGSHGISAFVLEDSMPGFQVGKHEDKLGVRGSPTTEIICQDVRVPA